MEKRVTEWQILFTMTSGKDDFYTEDEDEYNEYFQELKDNGELNTVEQCIKKDYIWNDETEDWEEDWVDVLYNSSMDLQEAKYNIYTTSGEDGVYNTTLYDTVDSEEQASDIVSELQAQGLGADYEKVDEVYNKTPKKLEEDETPSIVSYNLTNGGYGNNQDTIYGKLSDNTGYIYEPETDTVTIYDEVPIELLHILFYNSENEDELLDDEYQRLVQEYQDEHLIKSLYSGPLVQELHNRYFADDEVEELLDENLDKTPDIVAYNVTNDEYENNADTVYGKLSDGTYFVYYTEMDLVETYDCEPDELLEILYADEDELPAEAREEAFNEFFEQHNVDTYKPGDELYEKLHNLYYNDDTSTTNKNESHNLSENVDENFSSVEPIGVQEVLNNLLKERGIDTNIYRFFVIKDNTDYAEYHTTEYSVALGKKDDSGYVDVERPIQLMLGSKEDYDWLKEKLKELYNNIKNGTYDKYKSNKVEAKTDKSNIEYVTPNYTGGGIYVYTGKLSNNNYFIATDSSFMVEDDYVSPFDVRIVNKDPDKTYKDDEGYDYTLLDDVTYQDEYLVKDLDENEALKFTIDILKWIIEHKPKGNYQIDDMQDMLDTIESTGTNNKKVEEVVKNSGKDKSDFKRMLKSFDENGKYAKRGNWEIGRGGYDLWYEISYNGVPVIGCTAGKVNAYQKGFEEYAKLTAEEYGDTYVDTLTEGKVTTTSGTYDTDKYDEICNKVKQAYKDTWAGKISYSDLEDIKKQSGLSNGELSSIQYMASRETDKKEETKQYNITDNTKFISYEPDMEGTYTIQDMKDTYNNKVSDDYKKDGSSFEDWLDDMLKSSVYEIEEAKSTGIFEEEDVRSYLTDIAEVVTNVIRQIATTANIELPTTGTLMNDNSVILYELPIIRFTGDKIGLGEHISAKLLEKLKSGKVQDIKCVPEHRPNNKEVYLLSIIGADIVKTDETKSIDTLEQKIKSKIQKVLQKPDFGFTEKDIDDYTVVEISQEDIGTKVQVRAELDYEAFEKLINELNPIVQAYDKNSYFEMEEPGIASAVISNSTKKVTESVTKDDIMQCYISDITRYAYTYKKKDAQKEIDFVLDDLRNDKDLDDKDKAFIMKMVRPALLDKNIDYEDIIVENKVMTESVNTEINDLVKQINEWFETNNIDKSISYEETDRYGVVSIGILDKDLYDKYGMKSYSSDTEQIFNQDGFGYEVTKYLKNYLKKLKAHTITESASATALKVGMTMFRYYINGATIYLETDKKIRNKADANTIFDIYARYSNMDLAKYTQEQVDKAKDMILAQMDLITITNVDDSGFSYTGKYSGGSENVTEIDTIDNKIYAICDSYKITKENKLVKCEAVDKEEVQDKVEQDIQNTGIKDDIDTEDEAKEATKKEVYQYAKQQGLDLEKLRKQGIDLAEVSGTLDKVIGNMVSKSIIEYEDKTGKSVTWDFDVKNNDIEIIISEL